jgi:hypothetical protein
MTFSILKGIHRRALGLGNDGEVVARKGFVAGGDDKPAIVFPAPDTAARFDDFLGVVTSSVHNGWVMGGDTGQLAQSISGNSVSGFTNGVFNLTSSASVTQTPVGGSQSINTPAEWKANQGQPDGRKLRFGTRLKTAVLAGNTVFAGFTDTGGNEIAAYDTGGGIITPADNYVGFIWSGEGGATQQGYRCVAGKAGTDQVGTPATSITPTANVYDVLEIEVSPDGNVASFFVNGKSYAQITSAAVTPTTALAAGVWRANTDAAADAIGIDWINVSAPRDTGT